MKKVIIETRCPFCGHITETAVLRADFEKYAGGELVQNCFPYLADFERETLISGLCYDCQADIFGTDDDYENDYDDEPSNIDDDCGFDPYMGCFTDDC